MYEIITEPIQFMNGYSFIPLRIEDSAAGTTERYSYIVNIVYNDATVDSNAAVNYNGRIFTEFTFSKAHRFNIGDLVFITDSTDKYNGYYTVMSVKDSVTVVLDLVVGVPISGNLTVSSVIKYKVAPGPNGDIKLDLSNTLKDFVSDDFAVSNDIYLAPSTVFEYKIKSGSEGAALFEFNDNRFESGGSVGFVNSGLTSVDDVDFEIGDSIIIKQDLFGWEYDDNYFASGRLGFTGSTTHPFASGDTITVAGQVTEPYYNGVTTIHSVDTYSIVVNKTFTTSTPAEGGSIYGVPVPEYNTTAVIEDIYFSSGTGVVIVTDLGFEQSTPPIGGSIRHTDSRLIKNYIQDTSVDLFVYNSYVDQYNYDIEDFRQYVVQERATSENNISTILGNTERYRIETSTNSWLLAHTFSFNGKIWEPRFTFYDSSDNVISDYRMNYDFTYGAGIDINTYIDNGGWLRLDGTSTHGLDVGDYIYITDGPYEGNALVTSVNSTTDVTVFIPFTTSSTVGGEQFKKITNGARNYDYYFPIGVDQIEASTQAELVSGSTLSTIKNDISYYKVELDFSETGDDESVATANTNPIYFEINEDCSRYEVYHIIWKDARGSWVSYPFKYVSEDTIDVDRKNYYQTEGNWDNDTFGFDSFGRGEKTFFSRSRKKVRVTSGWVDEFENNLLVDMMKSAAVYLQLPDGTVVGCKIDEDSIKLGKNLNEQIFNYNFNVVYSIDQIRL